MLSKKSWHTINRACYESKCKSYFHTVVIGSQKHVDGATDFHTKNNNFSSTYRKIDRKPKCFSDDVLKVEQEIFLAKSQQKLIIVIEYFYCFQRFPFRVSGALVGLTSIRRKLLFKGFLTSTPASLWEPGTLKHQDLSTTFPNTSYADSYTTKL